MAAAAVRQRKFTVDSVSWTEVDVDIECSTIIFTNNETGAQDVLRRLNSSSATTEATIAAGFQSTWGLGGSRLFPTGTLCYLKATSGSFDVAVEYIL